MSNEEKVILLCKIVRSSRDVYEVKPISTDVYKYLGRAYAKTDISIQSPLDTIPTRKMKICGKMKFHKIRVCDGDTVYVEWGNFNDGRIIRKVNIRDLDNGPSV